MNLTAILAMICALSISVCAILWIRLDAADERADRAETALRNVARNDKVVTKYVDKIVTIEKRVPGAVRHLYELCDQPGVPGAGSPDATAEADARDRRIAGLAADAGACAQNAEQLMALQEVLRPQLE